MDTIQKVGEWLAASGSITATGVLLVVLLVMKFGAGFYVRRKYQDDVANQRRWMINLRNLMMLFVLIGVVLIWAPELRAIALSLAAVAVAIVVAFKEAILCFLGGFFRAAENTFRVGDVVEIKSIRGEVVDIGVMHFDVEEIRKIEGSDVRTGRIVSVPNSVLLSENLAKETYGRHFCDHPMVFTFRIDQDCSLVESLLLEYAKAEFEKHEALMAKYRQQVSRRHGIDFTIVEPAVCWHQAGVDQMELSLVMTLPRREKERLASEITKRLFADLGPDFLAQAVFRPALPDRLAA